MVLAAILSPTCVRTGTVAHRHMPSSVTVLHHQVNAPPMGYAGPDWAVDRRSSCSGLYTCTFLYAEHARKLPIRFSAGYTNLDSTAGLWCLFTFVRFPR